MKPLHTLRPLCGVLLWCGVAVAQAGTITRPAVLPLVIDLPSQALAQIDPVLVSASFIDQVIHDQPVQAYLRYFQALDAERLHQKLDTQPRQLAFWINVYNGYTQHFLKTDPSTYLKDRPKYFSQDQIDIVGDRVSLADIEHGVLRRGATIYTLGHIRALFFRRAFIRQFAIDTVDYRIHFALNCGALSCPAVQPYTAALVNQQLDANTGDYLQREVRYDAAQNVVQVPAFLRWFSADFDGGGDAAKLQILRRFGAIPLQAMPRIDYRKYDWTLKVENYALFTPSHAR